MSPLPVTGLPADLDRAYAETVLKPALDQVDQWRDLLVRHKTDEMVRRAGDLKGEDALYILGEIKGIMAMAAFLKSKVRHTNRGKEGPDGS